MDKRKGNRRREDVGSGEGEKENTMTEKKSGRRKNEEDGTQRGISEGDRSTDRGRKTQTRCLGWQE